MTENTTVDTHKRTPVLQRSRRDWWAVAAITAITAAGIGGVVATAPIHDSELTPANPAYEQPLALNFLGFSYTTAWQAPAQDASNFRPVVSGGLVISAVRDGSDWVINALEPESGDTIWSYRRDVELCSLQQAWDSVVAVYKTGVGCGDAVRIDSATGTYKATRSALAASSVVPVSSNDRVGIVAPERMELWRSDLVRTLEYGEVSAKQEPGLQPHEDCVISSALTRTENVAVVQTCQGQQWLRLLKATPKESRTPEVTASVALTGTGNQVVAIDQQGAAVYSPAQSASESATITSYDKDGNPRNSTGASAAPLVDEATKAAHEVAFAPQTADLPHHMSWFDGDKLYLFMPSTLDVVHVFPDAIGTPIALNNMVVYPTAEGLTAVNWDNGAVTRTIPIDRGDYRGPVSLQATGHYIVEKRGDTVAVLHPGS